MWNRKVLGVLVGLTLAAFGSHPPQLTRENFDRVKTGMTRAEVDAILGPAGDYSTVPHIVLEPPGPGPDYVGWITDKQDILIGFDRTTGRVQDKQFTPIDDCRDEVLDDILWRAERLWREWFP